MAFGSDSRIMPSSTIASSFGLGSAGSSWRRLAVTGNEPDVTLRRCGRAEPLQGRGAMLPPVGRVAKPHLQVPQEPRFVTLAGRSQAGEDLRTVIRHRD